MSNRQKIGISMALVVCLSIIILLSQFFLRESYTATPGNDRIAFVAASSPGLSGLFVNYDIYVMNINTFGLIRITRQVDIDTMPTWSPQGDKIAYYSTNGLYITDTDGSGQPELLWDGVAVDPAWSPDGSKIAFADYESIRILDIETKQAIQLTDGAIPSNQPTWSPDNNKIAFTLNPYLVTPGAEANSSIAVINIDGSDFTQLTSNEDSSEPQWSPDGNQIVFQRSGNIYIMNVDGTNIRALTRDGESYSPTWSPDGKKIAFVSAVNRRCGLRVLDGPRFCTGELRVINLDNQNIAIIRNKKNKNVLHPAWAPKN